MSPGGPIPGRQGVFGWAGIDGGPRIARMPPGLMIGWCTIVSMTAATPGIDDCQACPDRTGVGWFGAESPRLAGRVNGRIKRKVGGASPVGAREPQSFEGS
jgi:hypothetical protein